MAKKTASKTATRPRPDPDLDKANREKRRLKALVQAKRDIARKVNELRRAITASDAGLRALAADIGKADADRAVGEELRRRAPASPETDPVF